MVVVVGPDVLVPVLIESPREVALERVLSAVALATRDGVPVQQVT